MMRIINAGDRVMNTWIYEIPEGYVMIDTGYPGKLKSVEKRMKRHGIQWSDIRCLFLTHAHDDHAGFLNELMEKCPHIQVIANPDSLPVLRKGRNPFKGGCSTLKAFLFCKCMSLWGKGKHLFPPLSEGFDDRIMWITEGRNPERPGNTARRQDPVHAGPHGRFRFAEGGPGDLPGRRGHERFPQQPSDHDLGGRPGCFRPVLGSPDRGGCGHTVSGSREALREEGTCPFQAGCRQNEALSSKMTYCEKDRRQKHVVLVRIGICGVRGADVHPCQDRH